MSVLPPSTSFNSRTSSFSQKQKRSMSIKSEKSFNSLTKNSFEYMYTNNCTKYKTRPLPCIKNNNKLNSIEIWGDCMKVNDWQAALEALSFSISTHHVRIKNKLYTKNLANFDTFSSVMEAPKNVSASCTQYVVHTIASFVHDLLTDTHALVCLELENVLFDERSLETLVSGVKVNRTLQHLSLAHCRIGDRACLTLCRVLRNQPNIRSVDLTACALTTESGAGLVDVIKMQQFKRHEECWAHSLRSRYADPDAMNGLRRLTLNDNVGLGDNGVAELFESLKDDFYVKSVDLQKCGLTDRGAQLAMSMLMVNDTLVVLDIRNNGLIASAMLETVMAKLYENNVDKPETGQWKWTKLGRKNASVNSYIRV